MNRDQPAGHPFYRWLLAELGRPVRGVWLVHPRPSPELCLFDVSDIHIGEPGYPPRIEPANEDFA